MWLLYALQHCPFLVLRRETEQINIDFSGRAEKWSLGLEASIFSGPVRGGAVPVWQLGANREKHVHGLALGHRLE